jgi:hypothetical protein
MDQATFLRERMSMEAAQFKFIGIFELMSTILIFELNFNYFCGKHSLLNAYYYSSNTIAIYLTIF